MTARSPFSFPGDRTFAGWWRQFAPLQPTGLWAGHFLIQNVELLTRTQVATPLDPLFRFVLNEMSVARSVTIDHLQTRFQLGTACSLALAELQKAGLIDSVDDAWSLTNLGREGLEHGFYPTPHYTRESFRFIDLRPHRPPYRIKPSDAVPRIPWPEQLPAQQGLPIATVRELLPEIDITPFPENSDFPPLWQRVPVIRAERLSVGVVAVASEGSLAMRLLALKPDSWTVPSLEPLLNLPADAIPPTHLECWRRAWRDWCLARQISEESSSACHLERRQHRLAVQAPQNLLDKLKAGRSDVFKGDTWLVAGEGLWREGALIVLETRVATP